MSVTVTVDDTKLRELIANTGKEVQFIVADGVHYGIYQEFGTSKMAAHPFMSPAIEAIRPSFIAAFRGKITNSQVYQVCKKAAYDVMRLAQDFAPVRYGFLKNSIHVVDGNTYGFSVGGE